MEFVICKPLQLRVSYEFVFVILNKNNFMFTKGQWIFAILFAIFFAVSLIYTYRKDLKLHRKYYKGSVWVLIVFIAFFLMIALVKWIFV